MVVDGETLGLRRTPCRRVRLDRRGHLCGGRGARRSSRLTTSSRQHGPRPLSGRAHGACAPCSCSTSAPPVAAARRRGHHRELRRRRPRRRGGDGRSRWDGPPAHRRRTSPFCGFAPASPTSSGSTRCCSCNGGPRRAGAGGSVAVASDSPRCTRPPARADGTFRADVDRDVRRLAPAAGDRRAGYAGALLRRRPMIGCSAGVATTIQDRGRRDWPLGVGRAVPPTSSHDLANRLVGTIRRRRR